MTRGLKALGAVAVVVALVALGFRALSGDDDEEPAAAPSATRAARDVPSAARGRPRRGMYVLSYVKADGTVEVQTWLRAPTPISELRMTTTDPDLLPGSVESLDLRVHDVDGTLLAHRDSVGTNPQRIRLRAAATDLYFSYTIDGAMDDASQTVQTRTLARVLGMDVDYDGAGGVVRRVVTATGTVLNVACLRPTDGLRRVPAPVRQAHRRRRLDRRPPRRPTGTTGSWPSWRADRRWADVLGTPGRVGVPLGQEPHLCEQLG